MAICKMCHKPVPDGVDFCDECENKRMNQADESYLDSLLSSVSADLNSYSENVSKNLSDHIASINPVHSTKDNSETEQLNKEKTEETNAVSDEIFSEETVSDEIISEEIISDESISEDIVPETDVSETIAEDIIEPEEDLIVSEEDLIVSEETLPEPEPDVPEPEEDNTDVDELLDSLLADMDAVEDKNKQEEESVDPINPDDLTDIFAAAEENHISSSEDNEIPDITVIDDQNQSIPGIEEIDFSSDPIDSTKLSIDEVDPGQLNTTNVFLTEEDLENSENSEPEPVIPIGDFDVDQVMKEIDSGDFDKEIDKLSKKEKKSKASADNKEKKSLFQRLFGNVYEDITPEEKAKREAKAKAEEEKKKLHEELKKKKKEQTKEEKEAQKAQNKIDKEEAAKKKAEEKKLKAAEAAEKKRKKKEEKLAIEEFEVDEGRINRAGATILFVIFAIFTVFIIVGTNIYSYNLSIKNASDEFEIKHYNDAYYEVYGLKIQEDDIELYDKIMTVMYVNTQLNSYKYYMTSNNKDKALDSLLKGLQRYEKYLQLARELDIEDDLNYVKSNILDELEEQFKLSEKDAYDMIEIRDDVDYSEYIFTLLGTYEVDFGE